MRVPNSKQSRIHFIATARLYLFSPLFSNFSTGDLHLSSRRRDTRHKTPDPRHQKILVRKELDKISLSGHPLDDH